MTTESSKSSSVKVAFSGNIILLLLFLVVQFTICFPWHIYVKSAFAIIAIFFYGNILKKYLSVPLLLFSVSYVVILYLFGHPSSNFESFSFLICPCLYYCLGGYLVDLKDANPKTVAVIWVLVSISVSAYLWYLLVQDTITVGVINPLRLIDKFDDKFFSATIMGLMLSIGISCIAITLTKSGLSIKERMLCLLVSLMSLFGTIHLVSRTGIVIFSLTVCVVFWCIVRRQENNTLPLVFIFCVIAFLIYKLINDTNVTIEYTTREVDAEYSTLTAGGRVNLWINALAKIPYNPLGWEQKGFCHNLWLDVARETGWIPFVILIVVFIRAIKDALEIYKCSEAQQYLFLIGIFVCVTLQVCVEPALNGCSTVVYLYFFLMGIMRECVININIKEDNSIDTL